MSTQPIDAEGDAADVGMPVALVALVLLVLGGAGGIAVGLWFLDKVAR